jgi:hypothetical protein
MTIQNPDTNCGGQEQKNMSLRARAVLAVTLIAVVGGSAGVVGLVATRERDNPFVHSLQPFTVTAHNGANVEMWGVRDQQNCVAYVMRRAGYDVDSRMWVDPFDYSNFFTLLELDYTLKDRFMVEAVKPLKTFPEGSWVLFYGAGSVLEHVAYLEGSGLLAQDFGHYPEEDGSMSVDATLDFLSSEGIIIEKIEVWVPKDTQ